MPSSPPPLVRLGTKTELGNRYVWIGVFASAVAILVFLLLIATQRIVRSSGTASSNSTISDIDATETTLSDPGKSDSTKSGDSEADSNQSQLSESSDVKTSEDQAPDSKSKSNPGKQANESTNRNKSSRADVSTDSKVDQGTTVEPNQIAATNEPRVRMLNVTGSRYRGGAASLQGLTPGADNPLRVDSDVQSVVFVIDRSDSMTGLPFNRASVALIDAIDALNEDQRFGVVLFSSESNITEPKKLRPATANNKESVKNLVRDATTGGGTEPYPALKHAIDLQPDAIVLLSDGEFHPFDVEQITQYNQSSRRPVKIHCVGLNRTIGSLERLAKENGLGSYTAAK